MLPPWLAVVSAVLGLVVGPQIVLAAEPALSHTLFDNLPSRVYYFQDTPFVLYHDEVSKNIFRSPDEGKTWNIIGGVPRGEAVAFVEHAFDRRVAFILTPTLTHYRTLDFGATWASFSSALPPALNANPLEFHARQMDWIMFKGVRCGNGACRDEMSITFNAFSTPPVLLLSSISRCIFAHQKEQIELSVPDSLVYCLAFTPPNSKTPGGRDYRDSRLYSSTDFFKSDAQFVDLGIGKEARGVVGIGAVQKYLVTALKPSEGAGMVLYVSQDGVAWSKAQFPHGEGLLENAYTIVESTPHSILVDVNSSPSSSSGTLFTSNSNGTFFVKSLENTNRNSQGMVDFEKLVGVEGVAIINVVDNPTGVINGERKVLQTRITFNDGGKWSSLPAPAADCPASSSTCSLHLHSVTQPHNFGRIFSSTAPGLVMGVGSAGSRLLPYDECDTYLSLDNGLEWTKVSDGARKYEFGDQGSVLVMVDDEEVTDSVSYSFDFGKTWKSLDLGVTLRARLLTTVPDSTSLSFVLLGTLTRKSSDTGSKGERHVIVHIDFEPVGKRKCGESDMERWYARKSGGRADCLMGHKQWFLRRKADADCVVAEKYKDPVGVEENCSCSDEDYECDYNFSPSAAGDTCIPSGPEQIPAGSCLREGDTYQGSSGYRLIPGNTCSVPLGIKKDQTVSKACKARQAAPGSITHQTFEFPGQVLDQVYFSDSHTLLAFTSKNRVFQSSNEGFSWIPTLPGTYIAALTMHAYSSERAYLITESSTVFYTTDRAISWVTFTAPAVPNTFGVPLLDFHPLRSDWLIWTGMKDCEEGNTSGKCRVVSYYTKDNGRNWTPIDEYVRICSWGRDRALKLDEKIIFCESYRDKRGSQKNVYADDNPLQLVAGEYFYQNQAVVFPNIVGFATFEEYMVVAELFAATRAIGLKISLNGKDFALAQFPPNMQLENQAYTVLESTTDSVFLHVTTHSNSGSEWGSLFKSNSNGTYYSLTLEYANRNGRGFVDFEKMIGLDGIALVNIVSNPSEATLSGFKKLQTKITHNDGGRWRSINPPARDVLGREYDCQGTKCGLHLHGYTERKDSRATYSSPSAVGLMLAVGNVGEYLVPYADSDTFLTRDGGFHWEEVHKDAHIWEYGDQGSILLLVNDEGVTDRVSYTLDEGLSWHDYVFGERMRVRSIMTVPMDTSRKFVLFGVNPDKSDLSLAVHLDFSAITDVKCVLDLEHPSNDDFELWSPSEERDEQCLFGQQTLFHRRIRDASCYIGEKLPQPAKIIKTCPCTEDDFECEFNYQRNPKGECVLVPGATPLEADPSTCTVDTPFWYTRTNFRKVRHSACEGGLLLDRGTAYPCATYSPSLGSHGFFFWIMIALLPFGITALAGIWYSRRRSGSTLSLSWFTSKGRIRLPDNINDDESTLARNAQGRGVEQAVALLASVPWFVIGVVGAVVGAVKKVEIPWLSDRLRRSGRSTYRNVRLDDDAELLRDYDEDEEE